MLNSHLQPKPYSFAKPERFRNFYRPVLPLLYLEKYTYEEGETIGQLWEKAHLCQSGLGASHRRRQSVGGRTLCRSSL